MGFFRKGMQLRAELELPESCWESGLMEIKLKEKENKKNA